MNERTQTLEVVKAAIEARLNNLRAADVDSDAEELAYFDAQKNAYLNILADIHIIQGDTK